jgi:hypothetical protein
MGPLWQHPLKLGVEHYEDIIWDIGQALEAI